MRNLSFSIRFSVSDFEVQDDTRHLEEKGNDPVTKLSVNRLHKHNWEDNGWIIK